MAEQEKLTGAVLTEQQLQKQTDLFIRDGFRVGKVAFQHGGSGAKPVRPFLPCQRLYLMFQYLFFMLRPPQLLFRFLYLLIECFQLFFHKRLSSFLGMST